MRANNGAVNQTILHIRVVSKVVQHPFPNALVTPASISLVDRVPIAIFRGQQAPLGTTSTHPEYRYHKTTTGGLILVNIDTRVINQEVTYLCPLIIFELYIFHEPIVLFCP